MKKISLKSDTLKYLLLFFLTLFLLFSINNYNNCRTTEGMSELSKEDIQNMASDNVEVNDACVDNNTEYMDYDETAEMKRKKNIEKLKQLSKIVASVDMGDEIVKLQNKIITQTTTVKSIKTTENVDIDNPTQDDVNKLNE